MINLDALASIGKTRDMTVVGMGSSRTRRPAQAASPTSRSRKPARRVASGSRHYFRSDHFNFAKAGVPAMDIGSGNDLVEGGKAAGEAAGKDYNEHRYHKPGDQYDAATWKLDGVVQTCSMPRRVGKT